MYVILFIPFLFIGRFPNIVYVPPLQESLTLPVQLDSVKWIRALSLIIF